MKEERGWEGWSGPRAPGMFCGVLRVRKGQVGTGVWGGMKGTRGTGGSNNWRCRGHVGGVIGHAHHLAKAVGRPLIQHRERGALVGRTVEGPKPKGRCPGLCRFAKGPMATGVLGMFFGDREPNRQAGIGDFGDIPRGLKL